MTDAPHIENPRGDDWTTPACEGCEEKGRHIAELEDALAAARASLLVARAQLDSLSAALTASGWGIV